jgi:diaminohydroxyphosphoribosylaminopyrimidine deaminase/5-amino-6-(5-phosphoribosylamino)uracil reductase
MMREAGISVTVGVLEKECKESHKRFFTFHNKKRPYIILKWAETTDGFTAPLDQEKGKPFWITSPESKKRVHKWRTEEAAILVGTKTVELDNPSLTARLWKGKQPLRVVIDKSMKLNSSLNTFNNAAKTLVFTKEQIENTKTTTYQKIKFKHTENELLNELYNREIQSVIIEGGTKTLQNFIDLNLWDEARVFTGKTKLKNGISAPKFNLEPWKTETISSDILKWYKNETLLN